MRTHLSAPARVSRRGTLTGLPLTQALKGNKPEEGFLQTKLLEINLKCGAQQVADEPDAKHPRYILKNLQYDSMHRLDLFTLPCPVEKLEAYLSDITIDRENPWTVQTFIVGEEYSSCAICSAWPRGGSAVGPGCTESASEPCADGGSATLVDDYGHHPREVAATIAAIRDGWPGRRMI